MVSQTTALADTDRKLEKRVTLFVPLGIIFAPLNSMMIAVALPDIVDDFSVSLTNASWLITGYLIAMASIQPLTGKIGDRFGRRQLILGSIVGFGFASLLATVAPNYPMLLVARLLQALTIAAVMPNGSALLRSVIPEKRRAQGYGLVGAVAGISAASGPPLGGLLVELAGWSAIFLVNIPVVIPLLYIGWRWLPRMETTTQGDDRLDIVGAILLPTILIAGASLLIFGLKGDGVGTTAIVIWAAAVLAGLAGFLVYESRHSDPVFQPRFFMIRPFSAASSGVALSNMAMYMMLIAIPLLLTQREGVSKLEIGLILTALSVGSAGLAPIGGRLSDRIGRRTPVVAGMLLLTVGSFILLAGGADIGTQNLVVALFIAGVGLGLAVSSMQASAVESVAAEHAGVVSGIYSTNRYLGSIVGSAIIAGVLSGAETATSGFDNLFVIIAVASVGSVVVALGLNSRRGQSSAKAL
jgi:EmrB/QacA subfamily drug resistance transporter